MLQGAAARKTRRQPRPEHASPNCTTRTSEEQSCGAPPPGAELEGRRWDGGGPPVVPAGSPPAGPAACTARQPPTGRATPACTVHAPKVTKKKGVPVEGTRVSLWQRAKDAVANTGWPYALEFALFVYYAAITGEPSDDLRCCSMLRTRRVHARLIKRHCVCARACSAVLCRRRPGDARVDHRQLHGAHGAGLPVHRLWRRPLLRCGWWFCTCAARID